MVHRPCQCCCRYNYSSHPPASFIANEIEEARPHTAPYRSYQLRAIKVLAPGQREEPRRDDQEDMHKDLSRGRITFQMLCYVYSLNARRTTPVIDALAQIVPTGFPVGEVDGVKKCFQITDCSRLALYMHDYPSTTRSSHAQSVCRSRRGGFSKARNASDHCNAEDITLNSCSSLYSSVLSSRRLEFPA
jgi:hypothetical protein